MYIYFVDSYSFLLFPSSFLFVENEKRRKRKRVIPCPRKPMFHFRFKMNFNDREVQSTNIESCDIRDIFIFNFYKTNIKK